MKMSEGEFSVHSMNVHYMYVHSLNVISAAVCNTLQHAATRCNTLQYITCNVYSMYIQCTFSHRYSDRYSDSTESTLNVHCMYIQ